MLLMRQKTPVWEVREEHHLSVGKDSHNGQWVIFLRTTKRSFLNFSVAEIQKQLRAGEGSLNS